MQKGRKNMPKAAAPKERKGAVIAKRQEMANLMMGKGRKPRSRSTRKD